MEKNLPTTPKAKLKTKRLVSTPERGNAFSQSSATSVRHAPRHRSAASMHDMSLNISSASAVKKKLGGSRSSLVSSNLGPSFGSKKSEVDNAETELGFLYDNYLQTLMTDVLLKKKAHEKENKILNQLGSINKEQDLGNEKLAKMKAREKDIRYLSILQNTLDMLVTEIRSNIEDLNNSSVNDELQKLKIHLEPFDLLRCQGIELPKAPIEQQKFQEILKQCFKSLQEVSESVKDKSENLQKVKSGLKESIETQKKIESLHKNLQTKVNTLQNVVLKMASQSLSEAMS
ncbi:uncharacterized protein LOC117177207 [Belonocnema kinseyi]|uniref:uncharacterized protein LOC117177207 n=1 Tax=Belonocnema kinseyi TaxID=2817044 RepID=UPI00143CC918|nr:uncharacterized protein LOC117177207 [Belonocnema kinseyi]